MTSLAHIAGLLIPPTKAFRILGTSQIHALMVPCGKLVTGMLAEKFWNEMTRPGLNHASHGVVPVFVH